MGALHFSERQWSAFTAKSKIKLSGGLKGATRKKLKNRAISPFKMSPHASALSELHKKPELIKGRREHYTQVAIFDFVEVHHADIYDLMYSVPNGGKRGFKTAKAMKAEGQKSGYPDYGVDAARGIYHGFRCELKKEDGNSEKHQEAYAKKLRAQGYCVVLCYGFDAAVRALLEYWNLPKKGEMSSAVFKASCGEKKAAQKIASVIRGEP